MIDFGSQLQPMEKALSVSELTRAVKQLVEEGFPSVWVTGEIANLKKHTSGHWYLTLKDATSRLPAVVYRGVNLRLKFDLKDGMEVLARGRLSVYEPQGAYQLLIDQVQPKGVGAQELALRELKQKLFVQGYFDPKRKRALPRFPVRVALVTSPTGAAVRDMLEILGRRWPQTEVWVCPVRVQGEGAAQEIAGAIRLLNRLQPTVDVVIIGRGGGSAEDLWAFNEEMVANAIFESAIPVVSAVGHEIDLTIADLVADQRALTPSEAAERVVPDRQEILDQLEGWRKQMRTLVHARMEKARQRVRDLSSRRIFRQPLDRFQELARRLDDWEDRLKRALRQEVVVGREQLQGLAARLRAACPDPAAQYQRLANLAERLYRSSQRRLQRGREQVQALTARLEGISPLNVLARGYSLTRIAETGAVVRRAEQVQPGQRLLTLLEQGRILSRVEQAGGES